MDTNTIAAALRRPGSASAELVRIAVAEKLAMLQAKVYFAQRSARADIDAFDRLMQRSGGAAPRAGDEVA